MPDNSLGFVHKIPDEGYPLYGDRGRLYNILTMDNRGLRSAGTITFNNTTLESSDFTFYLDSVTTTGTSAKIEESSDENYEFPEVAVADYRMTWLPEQDRMFLSNVGDPFVLFHESGTLDRSLTVSSQGTSGSGTLVTRASKTVSSQMTLKSDHVAAKGARFEIESSDPNKPHLIGHGVTLEFPLSSEIAAVQLEKAGLAAVDLPYTQISTSIPDIEWRIADGKIYMANSAGLDPDKSFIRTTRPELDSLIFQASSAVYDLQDHSLEISGIPSINVADALIKPKDQNLKIFEGATIPRLVEADLILDTLDGFHQLYNGDIGIISRNAFEGSATYSYTNSQGETFGIQMTDFHLVDNPDEKAKRIKYSVSIGAIGEGERLFVSPGIIFKGSVTMEALRENLLWDGLVKLDLQGSRGETWIRYRNEADLLDVVLPFDQSLAENGANLTAGLFFDKNGELYSSFVSDKRSTNDQPFFVPNGQLFFDQIGNRYKIEDYQRTTGESYDNNSFTFNDENAQLDFDGTLNILPSANSFSLNAAGTGTANLNSNEYHLNTLLTLDFEMPAGLQSVMTENVKRQLELHGKNSVASVDANKIAQLAGDNAARTYQKRSTAGDVPLFTISSELNRSFVFSKVDLAWSNQHRSFYSTSDLDLASLKKNDIRAKVNGYLEVQIAESPQSVTLFLEFSTDAWYCLSFSGARSRMISSDPEFNQELLTKKSDKGKSGKLRLESTDLAEAQDFIDRFRRDYLKTSEPQVLYLLAEQEEEEGEGEN